jgi:glutaredoxin
MSKVVLYTKPGCCLCGEVKAQLAKLHAKQSFELSEVNILEDEAAFARFHKEIPVVFIDGRKAFKYHLDEREFLRKLATQRAKGETTAHGA